MDMYPKDSPAPKGDDTKSPESEGAEEKNFLIPKDAFGGDCKPGDVYKIKVVSVLEDELEVQPMSEDKKESKTEPAEDDSMEMPEMLRQ